MLINFTLNGAPQSLEMTGGENVRHLLHHVFHIHSIRGGDDNSGYTGNDTILLNGRPALASLLLAGQLDGKDVRTVESLAPVGQLSSVQQAMVDAGVVQDGYNAPAAALLLTELLERCPRPGREDIRDALAGLMVRDCGYEPYFKVVELVLKRQKNPKAKVDIAPTFAPLCREVGTARPKSDAASLVAGRPVFVEDRVLPGTLHLYMLRSPHAHARITSIDMRHAQLMPGVVAILTHENTPDIYYTTAGQGAPEPSPHDRRMFTPKVRHVGDRVAAVLAETLEQARFAAANIHVEYEILPAVLSIDAAKATGAPVIHAGKISYGAGAPKNLAAQNRTVDAADPTVGRIHYPFPIGADPHHNKAASVKGHIGDPEQGFAEADVVIERTYASSPIQCSPPEPHTCFARVEGERLKLHCSTQVPFHVRRLVARLCGLPQNRVHVVKERVGGGYGSKQDILLEDVTAYAAWVTRRPVFFQYTREEEFTACSIRHVMDVTVKLGAKRDGTLTALFMQAQANTGPYGSHCLTVPMNAASKTLPLFLCDNVGFAIDIYYSNIPPTGAYQGYGAPQGSFALQTALAELAQELDMDHVELLRKNLIKTGDRIELLRILGEGREGVAAVVESCGLHEALEQGLASIRQKPRHAASQLGRHWKLGQGCAVIQQGSGLPGIDQANARVALCSDGSLLVQQGGADIGTGLDTALAKIAAEVLCVPLESIQVISGDTDATPFDTGAYASSGTYFSGNAVLLAARQLKEHLLERAALQLKADPKDLTLGYPGVISYQGKATLTLGEIAHEAEAGHGRGPLVGSGCFTTDKHAIPYGAHFCQVAVNTRTGAIKVLRYHALHDSGTPINPELALGQVYGGVLKSLGHSLWEELVLDEQGAACNASLDSYGVPCILDAPEDFRATLIATDDPNGPFGAKSISEIATNGAAPAVAIAIHNAVGVWIRSWPFTAEKVLRALGKIK